MKFKLTEVTSQYHTFVANQVLTEAQLNEFINYFEDQDRMSRIFLTGTGIICGFKLKYDSENHVITISQGTGITTDGDLLKLQEDVSGFALKSVNVSQINFAWVKKFEDNFANYRFFKRLASKGKTIKETPLDLWEILPEQTENAKVLGTLVGLEKMVVLLYLESYPKESDLCTAIDCDNQGVEQVARLRVLLVSQTDADYILGLDSLFSEHHKINTINSLPEVAVRRVVLNSSNTANYDALKKAYYSALSGDELFTNLSEGIKSIVTGFQNLLGLNISSSNLDSFISKLKNIVVFPAFSAPFNIQYRYDCIKDIVDTYNEILELLRDLNSVCNPDITAFPKHVMLGSVAEIGNEIQNYRHDFYKSPALTCGKQKMEHCRSLVLRMLQLISTFKTSTGELKITPSNKLANLSKKSIPFYYNVDADLLKNWDFSKTSKLKYNTNLGYHRDLLSKAPQIQEPLNFNIDKFDFYRIEGHQGKDYKTALEEIDDLKVKYGLAFDVKALSINMNQETLNVDDYECEFEDLNVLLKAWTAEQDCVLAQVSQFFSGYSLTEPGVNVKESAIDIKKGVLTNLAAGITENTRAILVNATKDFQVKTNYYQPVTSFKSNVISDNLITSENTLGTVMKAALEENKDGSANDIIAKAGSLAAEKINADVWKEQAAVKDLVIDKSIELMAYSHVLTQKMPGNLTHISLDSVDEYKITLKQLCSLVERLKKIYQTVELSVTLKAFMGVLITQLSSICCSAKKLEVLLDEINKRKENIIVRLKLSKFVEKYPGLEHKAGVEPGGTFFLIYLNKTSVSTEKPSTEILETTGSISAAKRSFNLVTASAANVSVSKESIVNNVLVNEKVAAVSRLDILDRITKITDIPNNTVVADFSLPYMCCSDCAPVNFIVEKPPVSLRLPTDDYCLGKDTEPLTFEVLPVGGVIKPNIEVAGMSIEGTKLSFDVNAFPDEALGKTISFKVNEQITSCEIKVYRSVKFDFKVPESPTSETEITFVPKGNLDGATFLWSFGDDSLSTERNPTHNYILPVNDENKITVSLTVTAANGVCQTTVEHEIIFVPEEIKIDLGTTDFCENNKKEIPFKVTPEGTKVKIEGTGVQSNGAGGFVFIPAKAGAGSFEFLLNGEPSGLIVKVHKVAIASFEPEQVGNLLVLTNTSKNAESFVWLINGEKIQKNDASPVEIELTPNSPAKWKLQLQATSKVCGLVSSSEEIFTTKFIEEPVVTCIDETKADILTDGKALAKTDLATSERVHTIWTETAKIYGGTADFKEGVLNDIDNFLSGKNNGKLLVMFEKLLNTTVKQILALNAVENKTEFDRLLQLFRLQLQLFYNILGCQTAEILKEFDDTVQTLLDLILKLLHSLKEKQILLPAALTEFFKVYVVKIKNLEMLVKHISAIKNESLI